MSLPRPVTLVRAVALFTFLVLLPLWSDTSVAQVQDAATMTVLRGQVAVIFTDGSAMQPAPSGTIVRPGDEIRTVGSSSAAITFFAGTEVELGADTILVVERVSGRDGMVDVSLKQVFGVTLNRVQTFTDLRSVYRIEAGGAVAVVRGTEFLIYGPTPEGIVVIVCLRDCDGQTTFANCPMSPFMGYWVQVQNGRVISQCEAFAARGNYYDAALEAVTAAQQRLQGDTRGVPAGQVQSGQQQEIESSLRNPEEDDDDQQLVATPILTATATVVPTATGIAPNPPAASTPTATASPTATATGTTVAIPAVSVNDVSVTEGDAGQTLANFTVSLASPPSIPASVSFATANSSAVGGACGLAGVDYATNSGNVTFAVGETGVTVSVPVCGDTTIESDKTFVVNLFGSVNATLGDAQGLGTILDDDIST